MSLPEILEDKYDCPILVSRGGKKYMRAKELDSLQDYAAKGVENG